MGNALSTPPWKYGRQYVAAFQFINGGICASDSNPGWFEYSYPNHLKQKELGYANWVSALAIIKKYIPEAADIVNSGYRSTCPFWLLVAFFPLSLPFCGNFYNLYEAAGALNEMWAPQVNDKLCPYGYFVDAYVWTEMKNSTTKKKRETYPSSGIYETKSKRTTSERKDFMVIRVKVVAPQPIQSTTTSTDGNLCEDVIEEVVTKTRNPDGSITVRKTVKKGNVAHNNSNLHSVATSSKKSK